jgi:hypothetical protein
MISDRAERIREQVPSEEFDMETARSIAQTEVETRRDYFEQGEYGV